MALNRTPRVTVLQPQVRLGDPHVSSDDKNSLSIIFSMYEALVRRDGRGGYLPALAKSWTLDSKARTWDFTLRAPLVFHNGDALEAEDVAANLERVCDPSMGGELGSQGVYRSYLEGAVFEALDARTLRIVTAEPSAELLDLMVKFPISSRRALTGLPGTPVGSGPYRLVRAEGNEVEMTAFAGYWGGEPPVGGILWRAERDADRRLEALLGAEADLVADLTPEGVRRVEASGQASVFTSDSSVCATFMCNLRSGVCTDRRVRQALNYALDVPDLIDTVMQGAAVPLNGPLTSLHFGCDTSIPPYPYDPQQAGELLAEAGYGGGLQIVLDVPTTLPDEAPRLARRMAEQYAKVGITTEIQEFADRPGYAEMVRAKQIDDACCFDSSPLSTYRVLREKFHSGLKGPWWQGYTNSEVDALFDQAQATADRRLRESIYRRAYGVIRDDAPWIFLYSPTYSWGVGQRVRGWSGGNDGLIGFA